ncbi:putative selenium-dependent hydroxylase accessory protein YqeC [Deltaproteobacteria bacterium Smac51]|nr:putative selenium-dependent hydroxylase accessory protein YqeC [Deltaproteobacteria bacterium Smac51]
MIFSDLIPKGDCITAIGGGGKTGLLEALEKELNADGAPALVTVTTRLGRWQFPGLTRAEASNQAEALEAAARAVRGERLLLTRPSTPSDLEHDKYSGIDPGWLRPMREKSGLTLLVEADGSMGRPLKAHLPGEPVLPDRPSFVVAVLGLTALTLSAAEAVHRPEIVAAHIGPINLEQPLTPGQTAAFVKSAWSGLNPRLIFLNQIDAMNTPDEKEAAGELAALLKRDGFRIVFGSLYKGILEK